MKLLQTRKEKFEQSDFYIFNCLFNPNNPEEIILALNKEGSSLLNYQIVILPLKINFNHHALLTINTTKRKVTYFDSFPVLDNQHGYTIMNSLSEYFADNILTNKQSKEEHNFFNSEAKKQNLTTTDKNEDEIANNISVSFTSTINHIHEIDYSNTNNLKSNLTTKRIHINTSNVDVDSDLDLQTITSSWKNKIANTPKQVNDQDSAVFMCKFLDFILRKQKITFQESDIRYFRFLMGVELIDEGVITY